MALVWTSVSRTGRWRIREKIWKDSAGVCFGHLDIFFSCDPGEAIPVCLSQLNHTARSAEIKSTRYRWNEKGVISYCTMPYALTSSFSSVQTLRSTKCLSSSQIRPSQWTDPVVALIEKWLIRSCSMLVIWSKQMGQLVQFWMLFDIR